MGISKKQTRPPLISVFHQIAGNATAGILLYRINFWMRHAKAIKNGKLWLANSADAWAGEVGGSIHQVRRAMAHLRSMNLIEAEQHLFGARNIGHVRLTDHAYAQAENYGYAKDELLKGAKTELSKIAQLINKGVPSKENNKGETKVSAITDTKPSWEELQKEIGEETPENNPTEKQVVSLWIKLRTEKTGFTAYPSAKERKLLFEFVKACPEGLWSEVLAHVMKYWHEFAAEAEYNSGASKKPCDPTIEYLYKYRNDAIKAALKDISKYKQVMGVD